MTNNTTGPGPFSMEADTPLDLYNIYLDAHETDDEGDIVGLPYATVEQWLSNTLDPEPLSALGSIYLVRRYLEEREFNLVRSARAEGMSWAWIAAQLGRSKQAVWEKYRGLDD